MWAKGRCGGRGRAGVGGGVWGRAGVGVWGMGRGWCGVWGRASVGEEEGLVWGCGGRGRAGVGGRGKVCGCVGGVVWGGEGHNRRKRWYDDGKVKWVWTGRGGMKGNGRGRGSMRGKGRM